MEGKELSRLGTLTMGKREHEGRPSSLHPHRLQFLVAKHVHPGVLLRSSILFEWTEHWEMTSPKQLMTSPNAGAGCSQMLTVHHGGHTKTI